MPALSKKGNSRHAILPRKWLETMQIVAVLWRFVTTVLATNLPSPAARAGEGEDDCS